MQVINTTPPATTFGDVPNGGAFLGGSGTPFVGAPAVKSNDGAGATRLDNGQQFATVDASAQVAPAPNALVDLFPTP